MAESQRGCPLLSHPLCRLTGCHFPLPPAPPLFSPLQVPAPSAQRSINSPAGLLLKDVQANGGIVRSVVNMKPTVMKISIHNRQQASVCEGRGESWDDRTAKGGEDACQSQQTAGGFV